MLRQFQDYAAGGMLATLPEAARVHLDKPQELLSNAVREILTRAQLDLVLNAFTNALHDAFLIGLVITVLALIATLLLPPAALHTMEEKT
jgi:hypothetical protein